MIGRLKDRQVLYDTDQQLVVGVLGSPEIFPDPEGDIALSPNGKLFVNGHKDRKKKANFYTIYRREDGASSGREDSTSATGSPAIYGRIPPRAGTAPTIKSSCPASAGMAKRGSCFCSQ